MARGAAGRLIGGSHQGNLSGGSAPTPELIVRVRRDGADGTYLDFAGALRLWPHPDPKSLIGKGIRATLPAGAAKTLIECMNRALGTGAAQVEEWRLAGRVTVRALAADKEEAVFILRAAGDAGERCHQAEQTLEAITEASPLAIYATDLEGRITRWNAAAERIFG